MDQKAINLNVQQRLRALEAQMQVLVPFCIALIETHPDRDRLRQRFAFHAETLKARALNSAIADDFLTELDRLRQVLDATFDLPNPPTRS